MANLVGRYVYVNGVYAPFRDAQISASDRGFQFADSVYEVIAVLNDVFLDEALHIERLHRSLRALDMKNPFPSERALKIVLRDVLKKNRARSALLYLQISRGAAPRNHLYGADLMPTVVITATPLSLETLLQKAKKGVTLQTSPDLRRKRCDVKTTELLPNVLALVSAVRAGFDDTALVNAQGEVTECSSANLFIYQEGEGWITPPLDEKILPGVTRRTVIELMKAQGENITERPVTIADLRAAREAFITSATKFVTRVLRIDDRAIPESARSERLLHAYAEHFHLPIAA